MLIAQARGADDDKAMHVASAVLCRFAISRIFHIPDRELLHTCPCCDDGFHEHLYLAYDHSPLPQQGRYSEQ